MGTNGFPDGSGSFPLNGEAPPSREDASARVRGSNMMLGHDGEDYGEVFPGSVWSKRGGMTELDLGAMRHVAVIGRSATAPPRPKVPLRPISERSLGRVSPLYISATAWPSSADETRVDAAYNQEFPPLGPAKQQQGGLSLEEINRRRKLAKLIKQMQEEKEAVGRELEKAEKKARSLQTQVAKSLKRIEVQESLVPEELR
ncbi:unnamed protein product [Effrenium voratum]|nr:unnamed protein product [Effrenium voratum]